MQRRECWLPTVRGWLVLILVSAFLGILLVRQTHPFLTLTDPRPGGTLVVEGWAPDYVFHEALAELGRRPYEKIHVTGGPIEKGALLLAHGTYAEVGAATLIAMGLGRDMVEAVPAPRTLKDRTYVSAIALRSFVRRSGAMPANLNVMTSGPHSRRTQLLFQKAFGEETSVGVIAIPIPDYDSRRWWNSSHGFRVVTGEAIAYVYVRLFFRPPPHAPP